MLRRRHGIRSCLIALSLVLAAHPLAAEARKAALRIEAPVHDFGSVVQGTKVEHDFVIRNAGNEDLKIESVVASCGCTATTASQESIRPGEEAKISVAFDTTGFSGEKIKTVRLVTTDMDKPSAILTMKGSILPNVEIQPASVNFGEVSRSELAAKKAEVIVRTRPGSPVKLGAVKKYSRFIEVQEGPGSDMEKRVVVSLSPEAQVGEVRDRVIVELRGDNVSTVNIPVFASVKGPIRLQPSTVSFGIIEGPREMMRTVTLESEQPISIKSVTSSDPALGVSYNELKKGRTFTIKLALDPSRVAADLRASVRIVTDAEEGGELSFNVYGVTPPKL